MSTPLRVLVIEDSEDDMLLVLRELRHGGYEPIHQRVQSAEEVRDALKRRDWELVLSDYALPRFNGLEALRLVQASGLDAPFILISGTVGEEIAVESMKAGAHDYLLKDNLTRLTPAVRRELSAAVARRSAEAALRQSQSLLALINDHTAEMLLLFASTSGADYRVVSVNRAWLEFAGRLGLPRGERQHLGRSIDEIITALAANTEEARRLQERFLDAEQGRPAMFAREWQRGGATFYTEEHLIPVAAGPGGGRHLLWASREVTERKRAEDQQRRLEAQLGHAQKLEALGTLASGVAHDFNNILAGLSGHVELIRAGAAGCLPIQESVQQIQQGIHRAADLVRRILAFSRKRAVQLRAMPLGPVVQEALAFLKPLIPSTVVVQTRLSAECPTVSADAGQIHQVLINLCTNAVQAMEGGTGVLAVALEPVTLASTFAAAHPPLRPGAHVRLTVSDTGGGMDGATLERLFEPFFTTKPAGVGTGLGLPVVQGIVKTHHGAVAVASEVGRGSSFALYFPAAEEAAVAPRFDRSGVSLGQGQRVLFVDDEEYLTQMGAALLGRLGYRVSVFTDPEKALSAFTAEPAGFDVLMTDLAMPGLAGTALASRMRQMRPDLPVILMTGYGGSQELERARALGFHRVLEKPYSVEKFSTLLERALAGEQRG